MVELAAEVLRRLGGDVIVRLCPNMVHTVSQDELDVIRGMMAALIILREGTNGLAPIAVVHRLLPCGGEEQLEYRLVGLEDA